MEIKRYFDLIWRWAWLIILGAVIAGGVAYLISRNTTPVYQSSARLLIDEAPGSGSGNEYSQLLVEQRLAQTYVEILTTEPVMAETINRLELPYSSPNELASKVSVSAPAETQILVISVEDTDPARAALTADTIGAVFIEKSQERESLRYADPIANWESRIDTIGDEIERIETEIAELASAETPADIAKLSRLDTQLKESQISYTEAFNTLNQLKLDQAKESSNVIFIENAQVPEGAVRPRTRTNTLLAFIAGAMLALGIIFLLEYLDDTVKSQEQISDDTGLSTVGAIAQIKMDKDNSILVTADKPRDPISEAYRVLRTNLSFSAVDGDIRTLLLSSSSPGEGKSTTTANLAIVMAQTGKSVIVVDADLRRPTQHKVFNLPNNQGLTTSILDSNTPIADHLQDTRIKGLRVLTSGPIPPNPAELLNSQRMSQVIEDLKDEADVVLFDSPPVLTVTDAVILAPLMDGSLLVVYSGETRRDTFIQAVERLNKSNATIFGVILNRLNPTRSGYYYYQYYNTYEYNNSKASSGGRFGKLRLPGLSKR